MRVPFGRLAAVPVALFVTVTLVAAIGAAPTAASGPAGLGRFMYALGQVESHGNYEARNAVSGAYGKYQFMPASWRGWAKRYLGDANATPTPRNQDIVAAAKLTALYKGLASWRRVAYWWLTGSSRTEPWTKYATRYVNRVMKIYDDTPDAAPPPPPTARPTLKTKSTPTPKPTPTPTPQLASNLVRRLPDRHPSIRYSGAWLPARFPAYEGGAVRYATDAGARATLTFNAHAVTWVGPIGPTRGQARVYVDGKLATTVELFAKAFSARNALFTKTWPRNGDHAIAIEVVGTAGRPYVAIDEFTVTQ